MQEPSEQSEQTPISPTLAAVRASLKRSGRALARHHLRMLRKHWPKRRAIEKASIKVRIRADMSHDRTEVDIQT
jgi:hypothetical protein